MDIYQELKHWQSGIAALIGFIGLIIGALWNFYLNRRRDKKIRREEMLSVTAAIYGEILLMRNDITIFAEAVVKYENDYDSKNSRQPKLAEYSPRSAILYPALADKILLLDTKIVLLVIEFHKNYQEALDGVKLIERDRKTIRFVPNVVLVPAVAAVKKIEPALREMEKQLEIKKADDPDIEFARNLINQYRPDHDVNE